MTERIKTIVSYIPQIIKGITADFGAVTVLNLDSVLRRLMEPVSVLNFCLTDGQLLSVKPGAVVSIWSLRSEALRHNPFHLTRISHENRYEMAEMPSYARRTTEGTKDVLSVLRRCPTECNAADEGISDIAVDSREKCGLAGFVSFYHESSLFSALKTRRFSPKKLIIRGCTP